jgi:hypothetical protein
MVRGRTDFTDRTAVIPGAGAAEFPLPHGRAVTNSTYSADGGGVAHRGGAEVTPEELGAPHRGCREGGATQAAR